MDVAVRQLVWRRANACCEYCGLPQALAPFFAFHVEHIRAKQHGGSDDLSNLALACPDCNSFKGPNLTSIDPETDQIAPIFNPRSDSWHEHFVIQGPLIVGQTPSGRASVELLRMNDEQRVVMREELHDSGDL